MKGKIRKILALFMTAVIAVCALSVTASAASIADRAKTAKSGSTYSGTLKKDSSVVYKVDLKKDGVLKFNITHEASVIFLSIYDPNGNDMNVCDNIKNSSISKGNTEIGNIYRNRLRLNWGSAFQKFEGSFGYELKKGTYYVELWRRNNYLDSGNGKYTFKATYPSGSASSGSSLTDKQAKSAYKDMVTKLTDAVKKKDYSAFSKLLDSTFTAAEKKDIYNDLRNDIPKNAKIDHSVLQKSSDAICGSWTLYSFDGANNKWCTPNENLFGIVKYNSGWKFSKSDKLDALKEKVYKNRLKAYGLTSVNGFFTADHELTCQKALIKETLDIRPVCVSKNSDGTVSIMLAFLNGYDTPVSDIRYDLTLTDNNDNVIAKFDNWTNDGVIPANSVGWTNIVTIKPVTAAGKLDLSRVKHSFNTTFNR